MSLIQRLKKNQFYNDSFWAILGNGASKGLGMIAAIYIARKLGNNDFGDLGVVRTTVLNFAIFSTFGLAYTATKYISEAQSTNNYSIKEVSNSCLEITLVISGLIGVLLFIYAENFSSIIFNSILFENVIKISAIWLIFYSLVYTQTGILAGLGLFKLMAKINFIVGIYTFISGILLTYYFGFMGAVVSFFSANFINYILNFLILRKHIPRNEKIKTRDSEVIKKLVVFSTPIALQEFIYTITSWLMYVGLLKLSNSGEVGLFSASMQWSTLIIFLPSILRNVILRNFSKNQDDSNAMVSKSLKLVFLITAVPCMLLICLQKPILFLYGNSYEGIAPVISVILVASIFMGLNTVYNQSFISQNKNWLMFWMRFVRDVGILITSYFMVTQKVFSPAFSLGVSYLIMNFIFFVFGFFIHRSFHKEETQDNSI